MQTYIWGIKGVSGDKVVQASSKEDAITKILAQIGSQGFWIA
jgi:hypothetical protein